MDEESGPLQFLQRARSDPELSARVLAALERGANATAEEVLRLAQEAGYSFTREEFQRDVVQDMEERFAAGDESLADVAGARKPQDPPESSCAKGCLSYTKSWHPSDVVLPR